MSECRVGSLPWFAGVFWLALSGALIEAARGAARAGWLWGAQRAVTLSLRASALAMACAEEGAE